MDDINKSALADQSEAVFGIHEKTNRVTIKIVDKKTKEVIAYDDVIDDMFSQVKKEGPRGACRHAGRKPLLQVHVRNRIYGAAVYGQ